MQIRRNQTTATIAVSTLFFVLSTAALTRAELDAPAKSPDAIPTEQPVVSIVAARDWLNEGSYEKAASAFEELARSAKPPRGAAIGLARVRLETGKYDEGIRGLTELNAQDSAEWHFVLARFYERVGRYEELIQHARQAAELDKNHAPARLLIARTLEMLGGRDAALDAYRWFDEQLVGRREFPRDPAWVTAAAQGFLRYSILTQTNVVARTKHALTEMLQVAYERLDRTYWPARIVAADLLREKFNNDESHGSISDYVAALRINEHLPEAHVGLGEVALSNWNFEETEKRAELALTTNPNFSPALHLLARKFIVERRYEQAGEVCERAFAVNPNDLVAISLRAAAASCRFDDEKVREFQSRAEKINPRPAVFFRIVGDALSGIRQYADSEKAYRTAMEFDAVDANARTELGMMYMQWGEEAKAHTVLDAAFALDPYNERTKFTLDLLKSLEKFARFESEHVIVRYDAEKDPGLGEFVANYLEEIYPIVTGDFSTTLRDKTTIEMFPSAAAFGVRITGRPWIPTVGACSGRIIAMTSPRSGDDRLGLYNLARVLKHEFTHTVTLAATRNRIPHWFTEGLAVYEEDSPRPFRWSQMLADAVRSDRLFTLQSIDWGFMRPKRRNDRQMAYAQSEWMCEYIVERFGYDVIPKMLQGYYDGRTQPVVMKAVLGIDTDVFDRDFQVWAKGQATQWGFDLTPAGDLESLREDASKEGATADTIGRLARAELDEGEGERALAASLMCLEQDGNNIDGLEVLCRVRGEQIRNLPSESAQRSAEDDLMPFLKKLGELQPKGWTSPSLLSEFLLRRNELDAAVEPLMRLQALCPMDPASWRGLSGIYLQRDEPDLALPQLLELARQEEQDATIARKVADIYREKGRLKEAQYWFRQSIYIDPFRPGTHQALGDVSMQINDGRSALSAYSMLTQIEPKNARHHESAAIAAQKLGDTEKAKSFARKAVELDPQSTARSLLP